MVGALVPARAETALDCFSENKDLWIPGCTALIQRPGIEPEQLSSAYAMLNFDSGDAWGIPIRGDIGVRYVYTRQSAVGHVPIAQPMGVQPAQVGSRRDVESDYDDVLPSLNVVFELNPDLQLRFSAAKVLSRAELGSLTPSVTATVTTQNATVAVVKVTRFATVSRRCRARASSRASVNCCHSTRWSDRSGSSNDSPRS